jgi:hypothetical protein
MAELAGKTTRLTFRCRCRAAGILPVQVKLR